MSSLTHAAESLRPLDEVTWSSDRMRRRVIEKRNTAATSFVASDRHASEFLRLQKLAIKERTEAEDLEALKLLFGPEAEFME